MAWLLEYRDLQFELWSSLVDSCGGSVGPYLTEVPSTGSVEFKRQIWTFYKHGQGVMFTEIDGKRRIDLHDAAAGPDRVDAWRLATYLGGLGREGEKLITRAVGHQEGRSMDERVQLLLDRLVDEGTLAFDGATYGLPGGNLDQAE